VILEVCQAAVIAMESAVSAWQACRNDESQIRSG
jgi:hypothetical protein